tara:strand:+ start:117 stop:362 length:246 start_codon:yes stop_codon:yes gene_type:complete
MFNIIEEITDCYRLKAEPAKALVRLQERGLIKETEQWIVRKVLEQQIITFCYGTKHRNLKYDEFYDSGQISFDIDDIEWDV